MRFAKLLKTIIEIEEKIEELVSKKEDILSTLENIRTQENTVNALEEILQEEKNDNMIKEVTNITKEIDKLYKFKISTISTSYSFYKNLFKSTQEEVV